MKERDRRSVAVRSAVRWAAALVLTGALVAGLTACGGGASGEPLSAEQKALLQGAHKGIASAFDCGSLERRFRLLIDVIAPLDQERQSVEVDKALKEAKTIRPECEAVLSAFRDGSVERTSIAEPDIPTPDRERAQAVAGAIRQSFVDAGAGGDVKVRCVPNPAPGESSATWECEVGLRGERVCLAVGITGGAVVPWEIDPRLRGDGRPCAQT